MFRGHRIHVESFPPSACLLVGTSSQTEATIPDILSLRCTGEQTKHVNNKKVLLRERKRHTARRVACNRYADLSRGGTPSQVWGGTPSHVWAGVPNPMSGQGYPIPCPGGYPIPCRGGTPSQVQGVPHLRFGGYTIPCPGGYPIPCLGGYPISILGVGYPDQTWDGVPPPPPARPGMGYPLPPPPLARRGMGYPPPGQTWDGVPPTIQTWMGYPPPRNVNRQRHL